MTEKRMKIRVQRRIVNPRGHVCFTREIQNAATPHRREWAAAFLLSETDTQAVFFTPGGTAGGVVGLS